MSVDTESRLAYVPDGVRKREMKVLVMGMGRTGTTGDAFKKRFLAIPSN